ncbi:MULTISPECIES: response regulator [Calothrix]|uniref:Response regulator n=2 Tax=Calothrix TaxID=1186 RepID=A0ABR8AM57_9CYAN|nr:MULTISPECIES: response regulator [Calothrix]MBD2200320.1 response regulator [Calothrix parietina FACHB-288]MBD2228944.1 response regulator [Calothrix anomala FACHB-343]
MRILLVEDDEIIAESLAKSLRNQHYAVDIAKDGQEGWDLAELFTYDLILLDVMLPKLNGIHFCQRLRANGNQTPVLLLTAQDNSTNKIMGLDAGADDYVAKPFDFQELLARVRALLRRGGSSLPPLLEWKNLQLDPSNCEVTCEGKLLHLTPKEYGLLELFLRNNHRIFSCSALIDHLWSLEEPPTDDTVRSHMKGLRQKLKAAGVADDPIETVYGIGYKLKPADRATVVKGKSQSSIRESKEPQPTQQENFTPKWLQHYNPDNNGKKSPATAQNQVATGISKVWQEVSQKLEERVATIEQASTMLRQGKLSQEMWSKAKMEAHKLAGSLGMFGSDEGSRLAQELESLWETGTKFKSQIKQQIYQLVEALRQELQQLNSEYQQDLLPENQLVDELPLLLIVNQDRELATALATETNSWAMRSQIVPDAIAAREFMAENSPDVVLLDLSASDSTENTLAFLGELNACQSPIPVIVLTDKDSLLDRVKVARLGGSGILQKPVSPHQVLDTVTQILQRTHSTQAKVMVVDDDPHILAALQTLLIPWGLKVYTLENPLRFLEAMAVAQPDLLILDVELPEVSGIELCQVIRNDPQWSGLPILFLTAHNDTKTRHQVFLAGADDYISKPIVEPELMTRILNRLERSRWLRNLAELDGLTLVANRRKSTEDLNRYLQSSERHQQPFCFAILELDNLKEINQKYGHAIGDRVLSRLGELLRQTFHTQDVVGRWGGTEFVVGMAGMTKTDGEQRLLDLLKSLRQIEFTATNGDNFHVSLSTAVVDYPQDGANLQALYQAADAVLERQGAGSRG